MTVDAFAEANRDELMNTYIVSIQEGKGLTTDMDAVETPRIRYCGYVR